MINNFTEKLKGFKNLFMDDLHTSHMKFLNKYEQQLKINVETEEAKELSQKISKGFSIGAMVNGAIALGTLTAGGAVMGAIGVPLLIGTSIAGSLSLIGMYGFKAFESTYALDLEIFKDKTQKMEKKIIDDFSYNSEDISNLKKSILTNNKEEKDNIIKTINKKLK